MPSIKELREHLSSYPDDMACAWALWTPPDVVTVMRQHRDTQADRGERLQPTLDDEEIGYILERANHNQDASYGITWYSLESELPAADQRDERVIARLKPGVRVKWYDPDVMDGIENACHKEGIIKTVQVADHLVLLSLEDGWTSEVLASELEIIEEEACRDADE
jgi:hypothetical protein